MEKQQRNADGISRQIERIVSWIFGVRKRIIINLLRLLNDNFILLRVPKQADIYFKLKTYDIENLEISMDEDYGLKIRVDILPVKKLSGLAKNSS